MKKFTRTLAALIVAAGFSAVASAQSVTLSTYSKIDFSKVKETTTNVRMSRLFFAGYNTICLPFNVSADEVKNLVGEGVMIEKFAKVDGKNLMFVDVTDKGIEAGMPYLIYSPTKKSVIFSTTDKILAQEPIPVTINGVTMSGCYAPTTEENLYGIPAQQDEDILQAILVRTAGDKTFYPTRCGFVTPVNMDAPVIMHVTSTDADATAINKLQAKNAKVDVYNMNGTLVKKNIGMKDAMNTLSHGIYVVNGIKFMVK